MNIKNIIITGLSLLFFSIGIIMSLIPSEQFVEIGSIIAVIMISLPAFYGMWKIYGNRGIWAVIILGLFALIIESIGIYTSFPYGSFQYTMPFGYKLLETTPWTVFIAWSPLVIGAWLLAQTWFKKKWSRFFVYLGILVGADIVLDPGAVARGLWKYTDGGLWFDVPLQNFVGWIISGTIAYVILRLILKTKSSIIVRNESVSGDSKDQIATLSLTMTDRYTKYLWIGSLSLLLSIFLWSGVNSGYELWLPAIMGIILGKILIFSLLQTK